MSLDPGLRTDQRGWAPEALSMYLAESIRRSDIRRDPSPHLFLTEVFPVEFYNTIRDHLPRGPGLYADWAIGKKQGQTHYQQRKQIYIHNRDWLGRRNFGDRALHDFWMRFHDWFMSAELQTLMLSPFEPELKERFGGSLHPQSGEVVTNGMINFHDAGYFIGPHPDTPDRIVTAIFYLPEPGAPEGLGTKFYRPKNPNYADGRHGDFADFDLVSAAPYRPNTALLFLRTSKSYHGVEPISSEQRAVSERFVIQYMLVHKH